MTVCQKKSRLRCRHTALKKFNKKNACIVERNSDTIIFGELNSRRIGDETFVAIQASLDGTIIFTDSQILDLREIGEETIVIIVKEI